jgi:hypothetical protein
LGRRKGLRSRGGGGRWWCSGDDSFDLERVVWFSDGVWDWGWIVLTLTINQGSSVPQNTLLLLPLTVLTLKFVYEPTSTNHRVLHPFSG